MASSPRRAPFLSTNRPTVCEGNLSVISVPTSGTNFAAQKMVQYLLQSMCSPSSCLDPQPQAPQHCVPGSPLTNHSTFDEFHQVAPDACVLQAKFHAKLTFDADNRIKSGILSRETAKNWVSTRSAFVPTLTPTVAGVSKTYKCETNETVSLYSRMMSAVGSAAKNQNGVSKPAVDKNAGGKSIALSGEDAIVEGSLYDKPIILPLYVISSSTVIAAPFDPSGNPEGLGGFAVYTVYIDNPGLCVVYVRSRAFWPAVTTFKASETIFKYPEMNAHISRSDGEFDCIYVTYARVEKAGLFRLMIASASSLVQVDTIILHTKNLCSNELDGLAISSTGVAIGAREAILGIEPGFTLADASYSPAGSVIQSVGSGTSHFTASVLARGLDSTTVVYIVTWSGTRDAYDWEMGNLSWKAVRVFGYTSINIDITGENIEIAAVFLHVNPRVVELKKDKLKIPAAQALKFDRICGNDKLEYKEDCESGNGCGECKCRS